MEIQAVSTVQKPKRNYGRLALGAGAGAVAGAVSRYIIPTKKELSSIISKDGIDSFVATGAAAARGAKRSIAKFGTIGAVAALGLGLIVRAFKGDKTQPENTEYTKLGALVDAPDYACAMMWYMG